MPPEDPADHHHLKDQTYTEEMRRWMARQSFWYRLMNGVRHPERGSPLRSLLLLLIWLVPLAAIALFSYFILVQRYLSGEGFSQTCAQETARIIGLQDPSVSIAQWRSGSLSISDLKGEGNPESWVRNLQIKSLRFDQPLKNLLLGEWSPDHLTLQSVTLELRGTKLGASEIESINRQRTLDPDQFSEASGFLGVHFDARNFKVKNMLVRDLSILWGADENNMGKITGTTLEARRLDDQWELRFTGGQWSMTWLKNAEIEELTLLTTPTSLEITSLKFHLKSAEGSQQENSKGTGTGTITLDSPPSVRLDLEFPALNINHLLAKKYRHIFSGQTSAKISFTGSTGSTPGITTTGTLDFKPGFGFGTQAGETFPILEVLGGEIVDIPLRIIDTTKGSIRFTIDASTVRCQGFTLEGADGERLEGTFSHDFAKSMLEGAIRIGIKPAMLENHPLLADRYFKSDGSELRWLTVPLKDTLASSTTPIADNLRAASREESE